MLLVAGSRLDSYEIIALLGAGGMGEVYRARDGALKRDVAIKVLPAEWSRDTERLRRFELEAQAAATLNHPNIVSIFHVGQYDGSPYIATELLQGETLRERLRKGPIRLREVLDYGVELARGLAAAHDAGIVHRDLKPENIWVTKDGRIKILDFGLAKLNPPKAASLDGATASFRQESVPGQVLGTVGYMSPEQVRGQEVDHRSDIFSFGVILYELLSGHRAFQGDTAVETMAAILKQEPPDLPETVPYPVRQTVRHCLEKDRGNRFQSARDLSFALAAMSEATGRSGAAPNLPETLPWRRRIWIGVLALALMALAILTYRLVVTQPQPMNWSGALLGGPEMAFRPRVAPDGHMVAFYALDRGYTQVAVMTPETGNWTMLTHSRERGYVSNVSWAPDGASIYYDRATSVPQGIYSVPVLGGDEHLVFPNAFRPEALPDGSLLAVKLNSKHEWQLFRFWPETGRVQDLPVATVEIGETLSNPRAFPGGNEAVVDGAPLGHEADGMRLMVINLATGGTRPLAPSVPRGTGTPDYAVSRDGKSVLFTQELGEFTRVFSVPSHGRGPAQTLFTTTHEEWGMDTAPDGSVYACVTDLPAELVSRPVDQDQTETMARFAEVSDPDLIAVLPDGRVLLTVLNSDRARLVAAAPGKNPAAIVATTEQTSTPATVAGPREIAFLIGPEPRGTIALAEIETGGITRRIAPGKGEIVSLAASPDGRTLYFAAAGTIWSVPSAGGEARKVRAGNRVVADPSGRELLVGVFESPSMRLFRVPLDGKPETEVPTDPSHALRYSHLSPNSWNADGRLLVSITESWFGTPAILDTRNGRIQPIPSDDTSEYVSMGWLPGGRLAALRVGMRSELWRFSQVAKK